MTPSEWGAFWGLAAPLAIAVIAAVIDWVAVWVGGTTGRRVERVAKPAVLVALLVAALSAHAWTPEAQAARPWLVLGLVASLAGDLLLLPPGRFVPGLLAFLAAHLAYLVAFLQLPGEIPWLVVGIAGAAILVAIVGRALVRAAARIGLAGPVSLYLVAITLMAVAATWTGKPAAIAGAWLFVASDAMLGWGRLRDPQPGLPRGGGRVQGVAVMVTYHLGQMLIVLALLGVSGGRRSADGVLVQPTPGAQRGNGSLREHGIMRALGSPVRGPVPNGGRPPPTPCSATEP